MMRRFGDRLRALWASVLRGELDSARADLAASWTSSFDELRLDIVAARDVAEVRVADRDRDLVNALERVGDAFERVAEGFETDRRDRRPQLDAVEFLLREIVIGFVQPTAVAPVVVGGSIDRGSPVASPPGEVDIDLSDSTIPDDAHVEVRSRFDDDWVHGFAIAGYVNGGGRRGYRLRRLGETEPLPLLFDAVDVRPVTVASDHSALDTTEEPQHSMWR